MQTSGKYCEVFAIKLPPLFVQIGSALFVGCVSRLLLSFAAPPNLHCVLSICERKKVEKTLLLVQVHKRKGRAGLKPMQPMQLHWAPCLWGPRGMVFG